LYRKLGESQSPSEQRKNFLPLPATEARSVGRPFHSEITALATQFENQLEATLNLEQPKIGEKLCPWAEARKCNKYGLKIILKLHRWTSLCTLTNLHNS
jgi:hypothetical protein